MYGVDAIALNGFLYWRINSCIADKPDTLEDRKAWVSCPHNYSRIAKALSSPLARVQDRAQQENSRDVFSVEVVCSEESRISLVLQLGNLGLTVTMTEYW